MKWLILIALTQGNPFTVPNKSFDTEDGCVQYRVTRQIASPFAEGTSYPIVFHEVWRDIESFERHCQREEIQAFFARYCEAEAGLAEAWNVCIYTDEPALGLV